MSRTRNKNLANKYAEENFQNDSDFVESEPSIEYDLLYPESNQNTAAKKIEKAEVDESVMKMVGCGAVPIAPPSQIIQLQPIVIPLAIVPYASQNEKILQHEKEGQYSSSSQTQNFEQQPQYPEDNYTSNSHSVYSQSKISNNGKNALMLLFSLLFLAPFILSYFKADIIPSFTFSDLNVIGSIFYFIGGAPFSIVGQIPFLLMSVAFVFELLCFIISLISLFTKKYSKYTAIIFSIFASLFVIGVLIYAYIPKFGYVANNKAALILVCIIGIVQNIISDIFAIGSKNNHLQN